MSLLDLFFPIATVVLAAGCFVCYKTHKPLREKAREEREAAAEKKAREVRDNLERQRQDQFNKEFMSMLDAVLRDPERYCKTTDYRQNWNFPHAKSLVDQFRNWEQTGRTNRNQAEQITALQKTIRELRAEVKEVHRAIAPYA